MSRRFSFPGEPLNETDLLFNGVPDPEARERLMFQPQPTTVGAFNILKFRRDFVLRGKRRTPGCGLKMTPTPYGTIGPFFPGQFADGCEDLTRFEGKTGARTAHSSGQAAWSRKGMSAGAERHRRDLAAGRERRVSPSAGSAICRSRPGILRMGPLRTDAQGRYRFRTVLPGRASSGTARCAARIQSDGAGDRPHATPGDYRFLFRFA